MIKKNLHISMVNMNVLQAIFGNNPLAIIEYLEKFAARTAAMLQDAHLAIREKNIEVAMGYFHQLKGPTGTIGLKKMYSLCEEVEDKIAQLDWDSADQLCNELDNRLKNLQTELALNKK